MRQVLALSFLTLYLMAHTELHQVLRVPVLFQHYQEHKQLNASQGFLDFLIAHYYNNQNSTDERDYQLPFKEKDTDCQIAPFVLALVPSVLISIPDPSAEGLYKKFNYNDPAVRSSALNSIWQPPRA